VIGRSLLQAPDQRVDVGIGLTSGAAIGWRLRRGTDHQSSMMRSQLCGGMIWGVSLVLHEHAVIDPRSGRVMNPNLAGYHIPVNALGIKGVGEIGITGSAGAVANAVARDRRPCAQIPDYTGSVDRASTGPNRPSARSHSDFEWQGRRIQPFGRALKKSELGLTVIRNP
jgi:hypothetical protein